MKNDNNATKLINWNGLSTVLTGQPNKVRSNNVNREHRVAVTSLLNYIDKWLQQNGKTKAEVVVTVGEKKSRKKRITEKFYRVIKEVPEDCELVVENIWGKGKFFYTTIYDVETGFESREWFDLGKAKVYIAQKLK